MNARNALFLAGFAIASIVLQPACFVAKSADALVSSPRAVPNRIEDPVRPDARLAVTWIGHATMLIQMDDIFILTDPVFTKSVGELSARLVEPGLSVESLPHVNVALISHLHFDHLSLDSLDLIEDKVDRLFVPKGGLAYLPDYRFEVDELGWWQSEKLGGLTVTGVKVQHNGMRYGIDAAWMKTSYTGWVVEYHGMTVYFGGDTAFNRADFVETAERFPSIDLALLPIAPVGPRSLMEVMHEDPNEAVEAFELLHAKYMVPMHFDTFVNSFDQPGDAPRMLDRVVAQKGLENRVFRLEIGRQKVLIAKDVTQARRP